MKTGSVRLAGTRTAVRKVSHAFTAAAIVFVCAGPANAEVSQTPLYLGGGNVPGNLALVPSVEWPTINSVASLGAYSEGTEYLGYFDPNKCYDYGYDSDEEDRHFFPDAPATGHRCSGLWSGNFLNWAATQTIDPFRSVLTGGYRVRDTPTETWLEKARHDGQGGVGIYPNRRLPATGSDANLVAGATPFADADWMRMRIQALGNQMRFRLESDGVDEGVEWYQNPGDTEKDNAYSISVRVAVCVPGMLEANCRQYADGWKPEGLIQQYSDDLRISVFGYLNDHSMLRDGGVLRARQKFVGPTKVVPGTPGRSSNANMEWDPDSGVLIRNPDAGDASDTASEFSISVLDSGAINYLNKFGQMTSHNHKNYDPVSELFYTALRYLKDQGNVSAYTSMSGVGDADRLRYSDRFPIITNWNDPVQYACQKNVILGIGDANTHRDKNLPGSSYGTDEPSKPGDVSDDDTVDVLTWTNRVGQLEGLGNSIANTNSWSGRNNSAYMAGLAYYANTTDIRPGDDDFPGVQTVSTHWVDVLEAETLEPPAQNQYYLATKYGGFDVPEEFDPETFAGPLELESWHNNDETLSSFGPNANPAGTVFARPDNYYLAGNADEMIESLTTAFANIAAELRSSASSVSSNSTRVDSDTAVFQAAFDSHKWSGELQAFRISTGGVIDATSAWNAATSLDALTEAEIATRKIFTVAPPTAAADGSLVSTSGLDFQWASLASSQQDALLQQRGGAPDVSETVGQQRLDYLRGSTAQEQPDGLLRERDSRLGDIVNSDPQFIHKQDFGYTLLSQSSAFSSAIASAYRTFRQSAAYQARPPMVIVGANDGMLHGFHAGLDANGGTELFAFVPHAVFDNLYELTLQDYDHRYYVDGTPRVADAWLGSTLEWRTIVVGTTGAGGRGIFALDITNPASMTSSNVLWEFTHPDMGYALGQPTVAPLPNGEFGVVVTSGYTGSSGGTIWILDPATGAVVESFDVPGSGDLGTPLLADLNGDRVADRIYVGDSEGQLWRFDLTGSSTSGWGAPAGLVSGGTALPLFVATDAEGNPQAITAALTSAFNDQGEHAVFFGTGSFFKVDDNVVPADPNVDSFYGIIDRGVPITGRGELVEQEILTETTVNGTPARGVTANEMDPGDSGWFIDLVWKSTYGGPGPRGERVATRAVVRGDRVIFSTLIPNPDPCSYGGDSWLMELSTFTGGRLGYAVFDLNVDGDFDAEDWISIMEDTDGDGDEEEVFIPVSGMDAEIGIMETPAILSGIGDEQDEVKVVSGSSGALIRINERGGIGIGRQSWRQLR